MIHQTFFFTNHISLLDGKLFALGNNNIVLQLIAKSTISEIIIIHEQHSAA